MDDRLASPRRTVRSTRAFMLVTALSALSALAGCGSDIPADAPDAAPEVAPPDADLVAARPYRTVVPTSYVAGVPMPMLILLHGYGGDANDVDTYYGFSALAESAGFLGVLPNGVMDSSGYRSWHVSPVHSAPWDVEYLRGVMTDVQSKYTVDPLRIYVMGFSQGAHMAHRLGCEVASTVAAFASHAGQVKKEPQYCAPTEAVSALEIHGTYDATIGYDGDVQNDPPDPTIPSAHETIGVWGRNDVCTGPIAKTGARLDLVKDLAGDETYVEAYGGCPAGIGVELWTMEEGIHRPDITSTFLSQVYRFLSAHPKPAK
jgi:polyhydroxybutyrate depolymerase